MHLERISILNFKNIAVADLDFSPRLNCLIGLNGMGKSNLLEAIHLLSFARGFNSARESALVRKGEQMMMVQGRYAHRSGNHDDVSCGIVSGKRKILKCTSKEYDRISEHIGRFPIVTISPADSELISGSAEHRRRLMDTVISQSDKPYLSLLIRYNKAMEARNKMLRAGIKDRLLYMSIEEQMSATATEINATRQRWTNGLSPVFASLYTKIAGDTESASVAYRSALNEATMSDIFERNRDKDRILGYTSAGIHRDDLIVTLGDFNMRQAGSQGQIKTFTIALRLAVFDYLCGHGSATPILLLDDIFDKLDSRRVERIMEIVSADNHFGQIFVTDTNLRHIDDILSGIGGDYRLFNVENGSFSPIAKNQQ